jgi:two-component system chemotaxis response regulator CheY
VAVILVVDDSRTMQELFKVYLMGAGHELTEAASVDRAMQLLRLLPVDLVVVDVNLPGIDGLSFVRTLRAHADKRIRRLGVLVITGTKDSDAEERAALAGADAFLHKPLDAERVTEAIERLLRQGHA